MRMPFLRTIKSYFDEKKFNESLNGWVFSPERKGMIKAETQDWIKHYLPINLKDKTVLDVGAGDGETARFFLMNGAIKVICIEPNKDNFNILYRNSIIYPMNIFPKNKYFEMFDLYNNKVDFVKIDIEGYEEILLYNEIPNIPMIVEIHGLQQIDKFKKRGFRVLEPRGIAGCVTYGYWKC